MLTLLKLRPLGYTLGKHIWKSPKRCISEGGYKRSYLVDSSCETIEGPARHFGGRRFSHDHLRLRHKENLEFPDRSMGTQKIRNEF